MNQLANLSIPNFIKVLKDNKIQQFHLVFNPKTKTVETSHQALQNLADFVNADERDFEEHEGMFFHLTEQYDVLQAAFVHRTKRGQAAGGVRFWQYTCVEDFLRDGMRLAKGMTHKNALAGLWWGGGKGVMAHNSQYEKHEPKMREYLYREYGKFLSRLQGCYVTAEDVGTSVEDMANIYQSTRFTTCIPQNLGGSGNPSEPTSRGVLSGMEAALAFKNETLQGKIIAVQGMGHVAEPLINHLFNKGVAKVIAVDIDPEIVKAAQTKFADKNLHARVVKIGDNSILFEDCDILSPCATGAILNSDTIPKIKAGIICGAANNQLKNHDQDDQALAEQNILYIPDFLTNRMGIVNCANEQYGYVNNDEFIENHFSTNWDFSVYQTTLSVLEEAQKTGESTSKVAIKKAHEMSMQLHPIFGHRGQKIINSLLENKWYDNI